MIRSDNCSLAFGLTTDGTPDEQETLMSGVKWGKRQRQYRSLTYHYCRLYGIWAVTPSAEAIWCAAQ